MTEGRYRTIVVDPPWAYNDASFSRRGRRSAYECMSLEAISALPIWDWCETDAHIYLWSTNGFMEEAHQIARAWRVEKKTILTWCKRRIGAGHYYHNTTEHVLFCVKGRLPCLRADMPTHFTGEQGRHSEKPAAFYDMVESMSPGPYLDVFARKLRFNWDAWGDEVGAPPGLPTPAEVQRMEMGS
jgi:N6-adenosine-specific RNA methylase IME4